MNRRSFLAASAAAAFTRTVRGALQKSRFDEAAEILEKATASRLVESASLYVQKGKSIQARAFGEAKSPEAMFLLGSITKPICMTALMTLFDQKKFALDDPLVNYIPAFEGEGKDRVTLRHLLSHTSGLPDQLPDNNALRKAHASLAQFVEKAAKTPIAFPAGSKYQYSSMGILLASEVGRLLSGVDILPFVDKSVLQPLGMKRSAIGVGRFELTDFVRMQTEKAAPESGAGDPSAKDWDWNSPYWRRLGAPWGGVHASAGDVALWLAEFLYLRGAVVKPETARLMITNQNREGFTPRGLGFGVGPGTGSPGCSKETFGHTGSPGTIAWADPATNTICVVLTSLPHRAVSPHPRDLASARISQGHGP